MKKKLAAALICLPWRSFLIGLRRRYNIYTCSDTGGGKN